MIATSRGLATGLYAFDLLHLNGQGLKGLPLKERRALLETVLGNSAVLLSQSLPGTLRLMATVKQRGLEGTVAKRFDSKYGVGRRSNLWLKHPIKPKDEFFIAAFRLDGKRLELRSWSAILKRRN